MAAWTLSTPNETISPRPSYRTSLNAKRAVVLTTAALLAYVGPVASYVSSPVKHTG